MQPGQFSMLHLLSASEYILEESEYLLEIGRAGCRRPVAQEYVPRLGCNSRRPAKAVPDPMQCGMRALRLMRHTGSHCWYQKDRFVCKLSRNWVGENSQRQHQHSPSSSSPSGFCSSPILLPSRWDPSLCRPAWHPPCRRSTWLPESTPLIKFLSCYHGTNGQRPTLQRCLHNLCKSVGEQQCQDNGPDRWCKLVLQRKLEPPAPWAVTGGPQQA